MFKLMRAVSHFYVMFVQKGYTQAPTQHQDHTPAPKYAPGAPPGQLLQEMRSRQQEAATAAAIADGYVFITNLL